MVLHAKEGTAKAGVMSEIETITTPGDTVIHQRTKKLISEEIKREYQGKVVALASKGHKKVLAAAADHGALFTLLRQLEITDYFLVTIPRMGVAYSH
jgi:hypothetical protein